MDVGEEEEGVCVLVGKGLSLANNFKKCMIEINCHGWQMVNTEPMLSMSRSLSKTQVLLE